MIKQKSIEVKEIHSFTCDTEKDVDDKVTEMLGNGFTEYSVKLVVDTEGIEEEKDYVRYFLVEFSVVRQKQDFE